MYKILSDNEMIDFMQLYNILQNNEYLNTVTHFLEIKQCGFSHQYGETRYSMMSICFEEK